MLNKKSKYCYLISQMIYLVDRNQSCTVDELCSVIEHQNIIDWLENKFRFVDSDNGIDFCIYDHNDRSEINTLVQNLMYDYWDDHFRYLCVANNGFLLLVQYLLLLMKGED